MERYIGRMLDNRYEILEVIGQGGMAVVYKAKCHRLNRLVAIKVLKPELADNADFRRRFHDESQAVAMLSHPNIVSVYDVSRGGDLEYIVMELIDGITLKQYMARRGRLNWREALHFITQVMRGLSHAHSRGIIHRDIKPQNIMILRDGSVKVADFGIAYLSAKEGQTLAGKEALGSVHYISPEQAKGERVDARSDIYSAGVVLYEMLTNRLPFEGDTPVSVALQHFTAAPLNPRDICPDIPEALEMICLKAMAPQIENRYASADEMIQDLEEFRKNPDVDFHYDMLELRGEAAIDEPTQPINAREIRHMAPYEDRRSRGSGDEGRDRRERRYEEEGRMPMWQKAVISVAGVILGIVLIYGLYNVILDSFAGDTVTERIVPNLMGMTVEEAEADPRVKDIFTIQVIASRPSEEEAGTIIDQDPPADRAKKSDFVIQVTLSEGVPTEEMINVLDYERNSARLLLENLHLNLNIEYTETYSDYYEEGHVISTDPKAGEPIQEGDTVILTVSLGKELKPVTIPTFVGMFRGNAESEAAKLNLMVVFTEAPSEEWPAEYICDQDIAATTRVMEGSTITLTVSTGPAETTEPPDGGEEGENPDTGDPDTVSGEDPATVPAEPDEPVTEDQQ